MSIEADTGGAEGNTEPSKSRRVAIHRSIIEHSIYWDLPMESQCHVFPPEPAPERKLAPGEPGYRITVDFETEEIRYEEIVGE